MTKKIQISGTIISQGDKVFYDWYKMPSTAPNDIDLEDGSDEEVILNINSNGGDIYAGAEIYTKLREYKGKITANIVGMAASSASFIAMAADHIFISPMGQMMIHNASAGTGGNADTHRDLAKVLDGITEQIADSYATRTGRPTSDFLAMMKKETWFTAKQAVDAGLADKLMFDDDKAPEFANGFGVLTKEQRQVAQNAILGNEKGQPVGESPELSLSDEQLQKLANDIVKLMPKPPLPEPIDAAKLADELSKQNEDNKRANGVYHRPLF